MGERPCTLLNISVGGACVSSEYEYHEGEKFLLKVKLIEDRPESAMFCQVLRVIEKDRQKYEYGCQFLELTEEDQGRSCKIYLKSSANSRREPSTPNNK